MWKSLPPRTRKPSVSEEANTTMEGPDTSELHSGAAQSAAPSPAQTFDPYDELAAWALSEDERPQTIGLFGGRDDASRQLSLRSRAKRIAEIVSIVRHYDIFHGITPKSMRHMLEELGPTFVKAGQILSMRSEILPESFCAELAKLRTDVEPMTRDEVLTTLRAEYDLPLEEIFDAFDDEPLGSASVAQVHRARLVTGEIVAVKVQRPHVQEIMAQDISIMRSIARHARRFMGKDQVLDIMSVIDELWQSFREETDFLVEAHSLRKFAKNMENCAFVGVPYSYRSLSTEHVVVMEYIDGISLEHTDELVEAGYDLNEIGTKLIEAYAQQMLDDGFFHADPHPGNILISGGRICFIDLGIMGRLSGHDRSALKDMIYAVGERDAVRLADGLLRFAVSDASDVDFQHLLAELDGIIESYGTVEISELDIAAFVSSLISLARRDGIEMPSSVMMLARMLVTLEGVVDELMPGASMVQMIADHMNRESGASEVKRETERYLKESHRASHALLNTISHAETAMGLLTRGKLHVGLDLAGSANPVKDFSRALDRLTMGIIIAGLFIGSSVIYYAGIQPLLFGIPVLGFVGFLIALALGLWLIRDIVRG